MFFKILGFFLLQGVLTSRAVTTPEADPGAVSDSSVLASPQLSEARARHRRCTCYSYKDKECVYYCHLDIIWINTPERTVPYGMSSYRGPQRSRRAVSGTEMAEQATTPRCICAVADADPLCHQFCQERALRSLPVRNLNRVPGHG